MELLVLGFKDLSNELQSSVLSELNLFLKDYNIDKCINKVDDTYFIKIRLANDKTINNSIDHNKITTQNLSYIIVDIIINIYVKRIIDKIINSNCNYLDKSEREFIKSKVNDYIEKSDFINSDIDNLKIDRQRIYKTLNDYLISNKLIILEGFINFRLRYLISTLENLVDKTLAEFLLEKEYNEFIKILQYFVEIQESKVDFVNVVIDRNGKYNLYDENNKIIKNEMLAEIVDEMTENSLNNNDILISSLITLSPNKIVLHINDTYANHEIVKIIRNVFLDKVNICRSCKLCIENTKLNTTINKNN